MQKSYRGAQAGLSMGTLWTPDLPLSLGQEFVSPGALRGEGPCSMSMPGNTRVSRGPVDAVHLIRSLSVLPSLLQRDQSRWESEGHILVWDSVTVFLTLTTRGSTHPGDAASKSSEFTLILVSGTTVQTCCPPG